MLLARRPARPLSLSVEMLWHANMSVPPIGQERVLPIPRFQLIVDLTGASSVVLGMRSRHSIIDASLIESMTGVVFRPGAARRFCGPPADGRSGSAGCCDQAHLVHDFAAFSGMTPGAFLRSRRPSPNHVVMA